MLVGEMAGATSVCSPRPQTRRPKLLWVATLLAVAVFLAGASFARATLTQHGDLFITFNGGLTPEALPRHRAAPIDVHVAGTIRTVSGARPPALRRIAIAINRDGSIDTAGLPLCPASRIEATSSAAALAACRSALVGTGAISAAATFTGGSPFPFHGRLLAFNSTVNGRRVILAHVYGTEPLSISRTITFHLRSPTGTYGTVLSAMVPNVAGEFGYLTAISLDLHRLYTYRGQRRSYLSASCPAPGGFTSATFHLARASMSFESGATPSSTVTRSCRVRP